MPAKQFLLIAAAVALVVVLVVMFVRCSLKCNYGKTDSYIGAGRGASDYVLGRRAYGQQLEVEPLAEEYGYPEAHDYSECAVECESVLNHSQRNVCTHECLERKLQERGALASPEREGMLYVNRCPPLHTWDYSEGQCRKRV